MNTPVTTHLLISQHFRLALVVLLFVASASSRLVADTVITGRIVYGTIHNDIGERDDPHDYLQNGAPIPHVWVGVWNGLLGVGTKEDDTISDSQGRFSLTVTGSPSVLTLVTRAKNNYVKVKERKTPPLPTDKAIKTKRDIDVNSIDYNLAVNDIGDIVVVSDPVDNWDWIDIVNWPPVNIHCYKSRAFYIASAAHASGSNIEAELGFDLPGSNPTVRYGTNATAWYLSIGRVLHITNNNATAVWHEYGHFLEDAIAEFALIPSYTAHQRCEEITNTLQPNEGNLCWAWYEGLADWFALVNTVEFYGSYSLADAALSGAYRLEDWTANECTANQIGDWSDPRAVENVVAEVLWDLVDDAEDPDNGSGVDEIANVPVSQVLEVITADLALGMDNTPCSPLEFNTKPAGLDQFWELWRVLFPGVVPELYSAYAFNGVDMDDATDWLAPDPVALTSTTHPEFTWSNDPELHLVTTRGDDDVSGSYDYFVDVDTLPASVAVLGVIPDFSSFEAVTEFVVNVPEGENIYLHCNTRDMAGHAGTTTHYGPVKIDLTDPYFTDFPLPEVDSIFLIGQTMDIAWTSADDLSGIDRVTVDYEDTETGFTVRVLDTPDAEGNHVWFLSPDELFPSKEGLMVITAWDVAGNSFSDRIPVKLAPHFDSVGSSSDWDYARVVSGDLDRNGTDDVVVAGSFGGGPRLEVFHYHRGTGRLRSAQVLNPGMYIDDLVLSDIDRDRDLDVVAVSRASFLGGSAINVIRNRGPRAPKASRFVNTGLMRSVGVDVIHATVRVVDIDRSTGSLQALVFGTQVGAAAQPTVRLFDVASLFTPLPGAGLDPVAGDWEVGDVNADGRLDFVSLGTDANGTSALSVFWGDSTGFVREDIEVYTTVRGSDVHLGDYNSDGLLDIFTMFASDVIFRQCALLENFGTSFQSVAVAEGPGEGLAGGDGKIVDIATDGWSEVLSLGIDDNADRGSWYVMNRSADISDTSRVPPRMAVLVHSDTAWGDFDNDGDLDAFVTGQSSLLNPQIEFWEHMNLMADYIHANAPPPAPAGLTFRYDTKRGGYVFSWQAVESIDEETPVSGLGYELRVGTTPHGSEILSWAHPAGPSEQGAALEHFVRIPPGVYHFGVRTVDSGWLRSETATTMQTTP